MKFIEAEQFLEQPKEVQEVFIKWWKENLEDFDLWFQDFGDSKNSFLNGIYKGCLGISIEQKEITRKEDCMRKPLLTEGQLREFIEYKTKGIVKCVQWNPNKYNEQGYTIYILEKNEYKVLLEFEYNKLGTDLLQAYWKVACEIAREY